MPAEVYVWEVTPAQVIDHIGSRAPTLLDGDTRRLEAWIEAGASEVNLYIHPFTGLTPAQLDAAESDMAASIAGRIRYIILEHAAAHLLLPYQPDSARERLERNERALTDLRYRLPQARSALSVEVHTRPGAETRSDPVETWVESHPEGEAFG